jgi:hypothetical protein
MLSRPPPVPDESQFEELQASELFCSRCRTAQPVRERLLLVLPDGELREYLCGACGGSVGTRRVAAPPVRLS